MLDFAAIGRIVDSVRASNAQLGARHLLPSSPNPHNLYAVRQARAELSTAISWAYTLRQTHADWTSDSRARRRYDALGRARRMARDLQALIEDDQLPLTPTLAVEGLKQLQKAAKAERGRLKVAGFHEAAPLEKSAADSAYATPGNSFITGMAAAFEEAFNLSPSITFTSDREAGGPFVDFVIAATLEMGDPMTGEGVRKAWDRARVGQTS